MLKLTTDLLQRENTALLLVCQYLLLAVAVIAVILMASVVLRDGPYSANSWAKESSKYLMNLLKLLGTPITLCHFGKEPMKKCYFDQFGARGCDKHAGVAIACEKSVHAGLSIKQRLSAR